MQNGSIILAPGPVTVSRMVCDATARPPLFHRSNEFRALYSRCLGHVDTAFRCNYNRSIILPGSGTSALESVLLTFVAPQDRLLLISNGLFGERIYTIALRAGLDVHSVEFNWAEAVEPNRVAEFMEMYRPTIVMLVALETSTGMKNPVSSIGELCQKAGARFFVDAVSAYFAEEIDLKADSIDVCVTVSNKALEGAPGLALVSVRDDLLLPNASRPPLTLDLREAALAADRCETVFTAPSGPLWALETAFVQLAAETLEARRKRYLELSRQLRGGLSEIGLRLLVEDPRFQASAITTVVMQPELATQLETALLEASFQIHAREYGKKSSSLAFVQFSVMGEVTGEHVANVLDITKEVFRGHA